jgi:hypothetical protein
MTILCTKLFCISYFIFTEAFKLAAQDLNSHQKQKIIREKDNFAGG